MICSDSRLGRVVSLQEFKSKVWTCGCPPLLPGQVTPDSRSFRAVATSDWRMSRRSLIQTRTLSIKLDHPTSIRLSHAHLQTHSLHQPILYLLFRYLSSPQYPRSLRLCHPQIPLTYIQTDTCWKPQQANIIIDLPYSPVAAS